MKASTHVFATDLVDEGYDTVLGRIADAGLDGVVYAATYHHARDVLPHNPVRKVLFHEGGACYFRPSPERYEGARIRPKVSVLTADEDPLRRLLDETLRRDLEVRAWTNNCHNTALGSAYPDVTIQNVFGDRYITSLCPANPHVRAYVRNVSADLAGYGVPTLIVETICYLPLTHGYHHERSHYRYAPVVEFLLGLCFCEHCARAAEHAGVDMRTVSSFVQAELDRALATGRCALDDVPLQEAALRPLAGGELGGFLDARRAVVSSLLQETVAAVRDVSETRVVFMDWSGGLRGYASGEAETEGAPARAWQDGVDLSEVVRRCDGINALGYTNDTRQLQADVDSYRRLIPPELQFSLAVRPMTPDSQSPADVEAKVRVAASADVDWVEFYHYGLMRLENLQWARAALRAVRS